MVIKGIYVLELENNKYYIGYNKNIPKRFKQYFNNHGSMYIKCI